METQEGGAGFKEEEGPTRRGGLFNFISSCGLRVVIVRLFTFLCVFDCRKMMLTRKLLGGPCHIRSSSSCAGREVPFAALSRCLVEATVGLAAWHVATSGLFGAGNALVYGLTPAIRDRLLGKKAAESIDEETSVSPTTQDAVEETTSPEPEKPVETATP